MAEGKRTTTEEFTLSGSDIKAGLGEIDRELTEHLKRIAHEAKIRRVIVKNKKGEELVNLPIIAGGAIGIVGLIAAPIITLLSGIGAVVADLTFVIEKEVEEKQPETAATAGS